MNHYTSSFQYQNPHVGLSPSLTESLTLHRFSVIPHLSAHLSLVGANQGVFLPYPTPARRKTAGGEAGQTARVEPQTAALLLLASWPRSDTYLVTDSKSPLCQLGLGNSFRWKCEPSLQLWGLEEGPPGLRAQRHT